MRHASWPTPRLTVTGLIVPLLWCSTLLLCEWAEGVKDSLLEGFGGGLEGEGEEEGECR